MQADIHFFLIGKFLRLALRTHVEADDDRVRCRRQQHVGFGDRAHARPQQFQANFVIGKFREQVAEHFHRTLDITFENDVQFLGAGGLDLLRQAFQRYA